MSNNKYPPVKHFVPPKQREIIGAVRERDDETTMQQEKTMEAPEQENETTQVKRGDPTNFCTRFASGHLFLQDHKQTCYDDGYCQRDPKCGVHCRDNKPDLNCAFNKKFYLCDDGKRKVTKYEAKEVFE